jgi:ribose transport system permease protein
MRASRTDRIQLVLLQNAPVLLFALVFVTFGILKPTFLRPATFELIAYQAAFTGILAVGMTFVLLAAGIDLSVGANMYVAAVLMGMSLGSGASLLPALGICVAVGAVFGLVNGTIIARIGAVAFVVTLASLFIGRGFGVFLSGSHAVKFPDSVLRFAAARLPTPVWHVPAPILVFAGVVGVAHLTLTRTTFGRQVYAVGNDIDVAAKSGIRVSRVLLITYLICGVCAGLATLVAAGQLGDASPGFGEQKEFDAIAAAVLGGTSLFGGRGSVFPGTVIGALLIQTIAAGLVFTHVDIYYLDMVTATTIFVAVLLDAVRSAKIASLERRFIRADVGHERPPAVRPAAAEAAR